MEDRIETNLKREIETYCLWRKQFFHVKSDIDVSDEELRALPFRKTDLESLEIPWIQDACSDTFGEPPSSVVCLRQGTYHSLYRVDCHGKTWIVRLHPSSHPHRAFHFYTEQWALEELTKTGLPSVVVRRVDISREKFPADYEILSCADGRSWEELQKKEPLNKNLLSNLGRAVAGLHRIQTRKFGPIDVRSVLNSREGPAAGLLDRWDEYVLLQLDRHIQVCTQIGAIQSDEADRIKSVFQRFRRLPKPEVSVLLHGDLGNGNLFADRERITAILDWEDCLSGDPALDIAIWGTFHQDTDLDPFLAGYTSVRALETDFESKYWLYYLRVALAKTVHRFRFGYKDAPGLPPASHRIQKGLRKAESLLA